MPIGGVGQALGSHEKEPCAESRSVQWLNIALLLQSSVSGDGKDFLPLLLRKVRALQHPVDLPRRVRLWGQRTQASMRHF
jgi:hypothetical protein